MKVSLITATYNSATVIQSCLESVAQQSYKNIEHLIVDGDSQDATMDIVKKFARHHDHLKWSSEPDKGIYDALNKGIRTATGDIIGLVHSDDLLAQKDILNRVVQQFEDVEVGGVYGDLKYVDALDTSKTVRYWKSKTYTPNLLQQGWMPPHPTLFLRREIYESHQEFNTNLKIASDYDFVLRIFKDASWRWVYLPLVITLMRVGGESNKSLKNILNKSTEDYKVIKSQGLPFPFLVLLRKNLTKIPQWFYS